MLNFRKKQRTLQFNIKFPLIFYEETKKNQKLTIENVIDFLFQLKICSYFLNLVYIWNIHTILISGREYYQNNTIFLLKIWNPLYLHKIFIIFPAHWNFLGSNFIIDGHRGSKGVRAPHKGSKNCHNTRALTANLNIRLDPTNSPNVRPANVCISVLPLLPGRGCTKIKGKFYIVTSVIPMLTSGGPTPLFKFYFRISILKHIFLLEKIISETPLWNKRFSREKIDVSKFFSYIYRF